MKPELSIIIPVMNEEGSLSQLLAELHDQLRHLNVSAEIVFVDDGSTDRSWEIIESACREHSNVSGIRFRRNFGKAAALTAAIKAARGDMIMMMDADLQDDPVEIPKFLETLSQDFDVVNGWKVRRLDPWHKVYPSRVFNWLIGRLTGLKLHDHNCGFKLFRREVAQEISIYGELHRFIAVLAFSRGFKITEIPVHHRPREHGSSKYGIRRFLRGFLDLLTVKFLTGYGQRPQHMLGAFGLFFLLIGSFGLTWLAFSWLMMNVVGAWPVEPIGSRPMLAYSVAMSLLGAHALSLGFISELLVSHTTRFGEAYSIADLAGSIEPARKRSRQPVDSEQYQMETTPQC